MIGFYCSYSSGEIADALLSDVEELALLLLELTGENAAKLGDEAQSHLGTTEARDVAKFLRNMADAICPDTIFPMAHKIGGTHA